MRRYALPDEPAPGPWSRAVVAPMWPLLAAMFAGSGPAWVWFLINGYAMGSPSLRREVLWAAAGLTGNVAIAAAILFAVGLGVLPEGAAPYALILFTGWKLLISYALFTTQSHTFGLYQAFGGPTRTGAFVLFALFLLRSRAGVPPLGLLVFG